MATLTPAQAAALRTLAGKLETADRGQRQRLIAEGVKLLGVSRATLYRMLGRVGALDTRSTRSDAGKRCVTREQALAVAGLVQTARRANGKQTMPLQLAAQLAAANGMAGLTPENLPSASTLARTMREMGCHPGQLKTGKATGRLRSPHPNYCWQVDASVCVLWYLPGGKMTLLDERLYNARKPGRLADIGDLRITRYVVVDHCSGFFTGAPKIPCTASPSIYIWIRAAATSQACWPSSASAWALNPSITPRAPPTLPAPWKCVRTS